MIPRYLLSKIALRGGVHLPKMRFLAEEIIPEQESLASLAKKAITSTGRNNTFVSVNDDKTRSTSKGSHSAKTLMVLEHKTLEFKHWEFRFWMVPVSTEGKVTKAVCRVCQMDFLTPEGRKGHKGNIQLQCYSKLGRAERIMTDQRCVICNNRTVNSKWGLYMCSDACNERFLHETDQPEALFSALERIEHMGESNGV